MISLKTSGYLLNGFWTLKRLNGEIKLTTLWFFQEYVFWTKNETLIFCDFNIIINYIFSENSIEIPQVVQKMKIFAYNKNYFHRSGFFDISCSKQPNDVII